MTPPSGPTPDFLAELSWRGLVAHESDGLRGRLAGGPISAYIGFDASARSLHVGNLLQVFMLSHLQRAGGTPYVIIGGGTGMIGDPSGKSSERSLLDDEAIAANSAAIRAQLERFLDFGGGPTAARMVDNRDWLAGWPMLDFLRDVGKHFTVSYMLDKESVQQRLPTGMSFTEFAYMTIQAADFLHLYREHGVELQMGGADQWGNITAGLELIRRVVGRPEGEEPPAFGLCSPLLLTRSGVKMGKSERGAVFLDPALTSPHEFYQYWLNDQDELAVQHLRWLTLMDADEVAVVEAAHGAAPERRPAQRALAFDLTARVHGRAEAERQVRVAEAIFGGGPLRDEEILAVLADADGFAFGEAELGGGPVGVAVASGLASSNGEARRLVAQGGLSINDERVAAADAPLPALIAGRYLVVRAGRKRVRVGRRAG